MKTPNNFNEWAQIAARAERDHDYLQARENWLSAVNTAKNNRNRLWAEARHEYCETHCSKEEQST